MKLPSLSLQNFRSYSKKEFNFDGKTTLIIGPNAIGKTNILEAIFLLATGKSYRAEKDAEMISYEEEICRVKGGVGAEVVLPLDESSNASAPAVADSATSGYAPPKSAGSSEDIISSQYSPRFPENSQKGLPHHVQNEGIVLEIVLTTGEVAGQKASKKRFLVNGVGKRMVDFVGNLKAVKFSPEDLEIIVDGPGIRREWMDCILEQTDWEYRRAITSYRKGLRQRNKLLEQIRDEGVPRNTLFYWDKLLIDNGNIITKKREELIDFCNKYFRVSDDSETSILNGLEIEYDKSVISPERLEKYAREEMAAAVTLVGPHRDDVKLKVDGRELQSYGSRGGQRSAIFQLKLAELSFVEGKTQSQPILLLDDIFSELDHLHRERLLEIIPERQTIITATDAESIGQKYLDGFQVIRLL